MTCQHEECTTEGNHVHLKNGSIVTVTVGDNDGLPSNVRGYDPSVIQDFGPEFNEEQLEWLQQVRQGTDTLILDMLAVLKQLEFQYFRESWKECPECGGSNDPAFKEEHVPDCSLVAVIKRAEKVVKE